MSPDERARPAWHFASNDRIVTVTATCEASPQVIRTDTASSPTAPAVQLVGPNGLSRPARAPSPTRCTGTTTASWAPRPWAHAAPWAPGHRLLQLRRPDAAAEFGAAAPSLIHAAGDDPGRISPRPLTFGADVQARRGSATMIPPTGVSPAVQASPGTTSRPTWACSRLSGSDRLRDRNHRPSLERRRGADRRQRRRRPRCTGERAGSGRRTEMPSDRHSG